jgi:hypothetical protein
MCVWCLPAVLSHPDSWESTKRVHHIEQRRVQRSEGGVGCSAPRLDAAARSRGAPAQQLSCQLPRPHPLQLKRLAESLIQGESTSEI